MSTMLDAQLFLLPQWVFPKEQAPVTRQTNFGGFGLGNKEK
jgi:hypothetical protein